MHEKNGLLNSISFIHETFNVNILPNNLNSTRLLVLSEILRKLRMTSLLAYQPNCLIA
jgi:hypothetical protein